MRYALDLRNSSELRTLLPQLFRNTHLASVLFSDTFATFFNRLRRVMTKQTALGTNLTELGGFQNVQSKKRYCRSEIP